MTSPVVLTLTGAGVLPVITLQAGVEDITALNFGSLSTAATPTTQEYTLTGTNLTENVTLELTGEGNAAFTITSPTNTTLTPTDGALSQVITITFNPTAEKAYAATLIHIGGQD